MKQLFQVLGIFMKTRILTVGDNEVSSSSTLENTSTSHNKLWPITKKEADATFPFLKAFL